MNDVRRRALTLLATVGLALGLASAPAQAASPLCGGSGCDGKGPVSQNCDDSGSRLATASYNTGWGPVYVQLIHSTGCHSYWARGHSIAVGDNGAAVPYTVRIQRKINSTDQVVYSNSEVIDSNTGAYDWTLMAGWVAGRSARACFYLSRSGGGSGDWKCTAWYTEPPH